MTLFPKCRRAVSSYPVHGFFFLLTLLILAGCAAPDFESLRPGMGDHGRYIDNVPFFRQGEAACGPAALAGVLEYRGKPRQLEEITRAVYTPKLGGTLPMDMERYAGETGLAASSRSGTVDALKSLIRDSSPVICLLDLGFWVYRQPHYVLVIGYDDAKRMLIMHDGATPNRIMDVDAFDRAWSRAGRWMLIVKPGKGS